MDFEIVIIGSDANAYYMARCAHEEYHKKVRVISVKPMSFVVHSSIVNCTYNDKLWDKDEFPKIMNDYVGNIKASKIVCISTNETYARFLVMNKDILDKRIVFNYVDLDFIDSLMMKDRFYERFSSSNLLPKTVIYDLNEKINIDFDFPIIIKPSNVIDYNHIEFEGKKKIYKLNNINEVKKTIDCIRRSDYKGTLIIQEYIPGDDSNLFDIALYSSSKGQCQFMSFAQIGLQERTKNMVGNAACLINGFNTNTYDEDTVLEFKKFIEDIKFKGLAEIDIKYDSRDKKYKILEINARQGRCGYYVSALGYNPVKYVVDDLIYGKRKKFEIIKKEIGLSFVPKRIIKKYVANEDFKDEFLKLYKKNKVINPLIYNRDLPFGRILFLIRKHFRYYKDYKNNYFN